MTMMKTFFYSDAFPDLTFLQKLLSRPFAIKVNVNYLYNIKKTCNKKSYIEWNDYLYFYLWSGFYSADVWPCKVYMYCGVLLC